jgi:hypothetical protein
MPQESNPTTLRKHIIQKFKDFRMHVFDCLGLRKKPMKISEPTNFIHISTYHGMLTLIPQDNTFSQQKFLIPVRPKSNGGLYT